MTPNLFTTPPQFRRLPHAASIAAMPPPMRRRDWSLRLHSLGSEISRRKLHFAGSRRFISYVTSSTRGRCGISIMLAIFTSSSTRHRDAAYELMHARAGNAGRHSARMMRMPPRQTRRAGRAALAAAPPLSPRRATRHWISSRTCQRPPPSSPRARHL